MQNLTDMGFPHADVVRAMRAAYNNPDRAAEYLMSGSIPPSALFDESASIPSEYLNMFQAGAAAADAQVNKFRLNYFVLGL